MTNEDFNKVNELFNSLVTKTDLDFNTDSLDGSCVIKRVYDKCSSKIETSLLAKLLVYNKHLADNKIKSAEETKSLILIEC